MAAPRYGTSAHFVVRHSRPRNECCASGYLRVSDFREERLRDSPARIRLMRKQGPPGGDEARASPAGTRRRDASRAASSASSSGRRVPPSMGPNSLVITGTEQIDDLAKSGDVASGSKTLLMISKVGIAVKAGAAKPDVSTPDKLKAALLAAKTVGYSQGASGQHFLTVLQKLGITDPVKGKAVVVQGRPVGAAIASGEAEIGVQQVAELRPVAGVDQFAEMPAELQKQIPYSAGIAAKAKDQATARALVSFLRSAPAQDVLKRKGMDLP